MSERVRHYPPARRPLRSGTNSTNLGPWRRPVSADDEPDRVRGRARGAAARADERTRRPGRHRLGLHAWRTGTNCGPTARGWPTQWTPRNGAWAWTAGRRRADPAQRREAAAAAGAWPGARPRSSWNWPAIPSYGKRGSPSSSTPTGNRSTWCAAGAKVILMASRALARVAALAADYLGVYETLF